MPRRTQKAGISVRLPDGIVRELTVLQGRLSVPTIDAGRGGNVMAILEDAWTAINKTSRISSEFRGPREADGKRVRCLRTGNVNNGK
jgi:hypothetical protein